MGLAEPRKRIKISHDPRNTTWTNSTDSYGQRLMLQQGWKSGEALGANGRGSKYSDAEAAKVNVKYKDDMLGLGASLKSRDIANQRTGFDAFQGLLGRLNAKTEAEVQAVEKKLEDKKLAMFAQGRWGGMVFVPGGLLVQSDPYKQIEALKKATKLDNIDPQSADESATTQAVEIVDEPNEKTRRKAEKRKRKEEKRLKKEAKRLKKEARSKQSEGDEAGLPTPDSSSANEAEASKGNEKKVKTKKRQRSADPEEKPQVELKKVTTVQLNPRNGRQLLRGKNIQAKRMAFSDMKGLDEIFMKVG